jgi:hypothetical protein
MVAPAIGDTVVIVVCGASKPPYRITFENKFDGRIVGYFKGRTQVLGRVLRPVTGTGRFGGSKYLGTGLLRANHPGVICISTGPKGELGGFQIIPAVHASDLELSYVRSISAWMVVGPVSFEDAPLEGTFPLFSGLLRPEQWKIRVRWIGTEVFEDLEPITGKKLSAFMRAAEFELIADTSMNLESNSEWRVQCQ